MSSAEVRKALEARTPEELDKAEDGLTHSSDLEAPYAAEQIANMRAEQEVLEERKRIRAAFAQFGLEPPE